jgi:uncharacterized protein (DUF2249 family)
VHSQYTFPTDPEQPMVTLASSLDIRTIPPRERHPLIFSTFDQLAVGHAMELVNDHDPRPLHYQFHDRLPGQFSWTPIETGPEVWRVRIERTQPGIQAARSSGSCCGGGCGGGGV